MGSPFEPCAVVELNLPSAGPLPSIYGLARYSRAQVLVRLDGVPVGYVRCAVTNGRCDASVLARAVGSTLEDQLLRRRLSQAMTPV